MQSKIQYIKSYAKLLEKQKTELAQKKHEYESSMKLKMNEIEHLSNMDKLLRKVSDYYSEKYIKNLEASVQDGLNKIFDDRNYKIEIEVVNMKVQKEVRFYLIEDELRVEVKDSIGSGVKSVIAFLIQVFVLDKFGTRYIFIDEGFTEISDGYVENLFDYLNKIVNDLGFNILLITHDTRFIPYLNKIYEVSHGKVSER